MTAMSVRALGYVSVGAKGENIDNQVRAIAAFARVNGITLIQVFKDTDIISSFGTLQRALDRDGFKMALEVAEALGIKALIVYDLTKLGRDMLDIVETYKYLLEHGYQVYFVKHPELNPSPTDSPINEAIRKAVLTLLTMVAEMGRTFINECRKEGGL